MEKDFGKKSSGCCGSGSSKEKEKEKCQTPQKGEKKKESGSKKTENPKSCCN